MIIRSEKPSDIKVIEEVTKAAFEDHQFSQQTEHFIIRDLRADDALTISLVAEVDGRVVGHIAFSPVTISDGTMNWCGLGPVSVLPEFQGRKIGTTLVNNGIDLLKTMDSKGCALVGLPTYYYRFGFENHPQLIHEGVQQEVFVAKSLFGQVPSGTVEFHDAFKQLSEIEIDAITDVIVDFDINGIMVDFANPGIESLIEKEALIERPDGKFTIRPLALGKYNTYFGRLSQHMITEMNRGHKNPILTAIKYGVLE